MAAPIEDYQWLISDAARPWLAMGESVRGCTFPRNTPPGEGLVRLARALRKDLSAERTHLVLEQIELRQRAREKFTQADQMFFTRKALEQATDEQVANYKASRFPQGYGAIDLCCGIGGDLLALARTRSICRGFDIDPVMVVLAQANLSVLPRSDYDVVECDAPAVAVEGGPWHCDPDRRSGGRRTTAVEFFSPSLESLEQLLKESPEAAVKLAPATEAPPAWQTSAELEWISSRGECRQQVAWFDGLARHSGRHTATILSSDGATRTVAGEPDQSIPLSAHLGRYLYEPDSAVLAAKLSSVLCVEHSLAAVSAGIAYLTSDTLIADPALDAFELLDVLPLDRKQLKSYCREHGIGRLEIKKRGVEFSPERLREEIIGSGDEVATILVAPVQGQVRAMIARRLAAC